MTGGRGHLGVEAMERSGCVDSLSGFQRSLCGELWEVLTSPIGSKDWAEGVAAFSLGFTTSMGGEAHFTETQTP